MALAYFTVTGNYDAFTGLEAPVTGTVVFSYDGPPLSIIDTSTRLVLQPVEAVIKDGKISRNNRDGCELVANVGVTVGKTNGPLQYTVKFVDVRAADGSPTAIPDATFVAPTTGGVVDLVGASWR